MPKIVDKEERRRALVKAAATVFAKSGYARTRLSDVAESASVSKGLIYEYFSSKEQLFQAVCQSVIQWRLPDSEEQVTADSAGRLIEAIRASYEDATDFFLIFSEFWSVVLRGSAESRAELMRGATQFYRPPRAALTALIRRGREAGVLRPGPDAEVVANFVIACVEGIRLQQVLSPEAARANDVVALLSEQVLAMLRPTVPDP